MSCDVEALAARLVLAFDEDDDDVLALTLSEFVCCPGCAAAVIMALTRSLVRVPSRERPGWQQSMMDRLAAMLDMIDWEMPSG